MPLVAGQRLSFYEILGPLGAGAMGEVYLARDTRLGREIAIKVLPKELAEDEGRRRRFEREARSLAALNHPNVAGIHAVDREGELRFLALELVPGEDLATRLSRGALPVEEAIEVCRQIAEGLEAAHESGVIHRDLKPANVRITPEGTVKLLDFGLAKPTGLAADGREAGLTSDGLATSVEGAVLGTPAYMSPEQVRCKPVDRRADVWAFGCVLFECLTGRRAYYGVGVAEVLAGVLDQAWERERLPAGTPLHVRRLLERCLEKDPRQRLRDIGEARIVLQGGLDEPASPPAGRQRRRLPAALAIAAALGIGVLGGASWFVKSPAKPIVLHRLSELVGVEEMPTVSPDGKTLAFVARVDGRQQVWLRLMERGAPEPLTGPGGQHANPRWIDESTLLYVEQAEAGGADGMLWEALVLGSTPPRRIGPTRGEADVSHSGSRIATFRVDGDGAALVVNDRMGRAPPTVIALPKGIYRSPRWSPDDRFIAFQTWMELAQSDIRVLDLATGVARTIVSTGQTRGLAWLPDGTGLVYSASEGSTMAYPPVFGLWTVRLDGGGAPQRLALSDTGYASYVEPDISQAGLLVASRIEVDADIFRYPLDGTPRENVDNAVRITRQTGMVQVPSASPDGDEVAYLWDSGGHSNVWVAKVDGSSPPRQLTAEQDPDIVVAIPLWSPRGDQIVYWRAHRGDTPEQWLIGVDGTGNRSLCRTRGGATWSSDGEWIYHIPHFEGPLSSSCERIHVESGRTELVRRGAIVTGVTKDGRTAYFYPSEYRLGELWKASPPDAGTAECLVTGLQHRVPMWPHHYALSPDGQWLATPLADDGTTNLWSISTADGTLRQLADFGRRSTLIGRQVSWAGDGQSIFAALMEVDADVVRLDGALP